MATKQLQSNAQALLLEYRPTKWRKSALEAVLGVGHKALHACVEQINLTKKLVELLRSDKLLGEKLYWIIYASYMTDREPGDIEEILARCRGRGRPKGFSQNIKGTAGLLAARPGN